METVFVSWSGPVKVWRGWGQPSALHHLHRPRLFLGKILKLNSQVICVYFPMVVNKIISDFIVFLSTVNFFFFSHFRIIYRKHQKSKLNIIKMVIIYNGLTIKNQDKKYFEGFDISL